jgi:ubiquinone biosynthesis monooxygenase Coq7
MRVNHTGEVCAQALYAGQALVARDAKLRRYLLGAANEERDHLVWCAARLRELEGRPSLLDPVWYLGSMSIAIAAAGISDAISLGFVEETEHQVCAHLDKHLQQLSESDARSRAIIAGMRLDEARHARGARTHGARELPRFIKRLMALPARIMTSIAYWI